jgi:hypothetical protein
VLPLTAAVSLIAQRRDGRLHLAEELTGADELLPARQHLAAKQGPVGMPSQRDGWASS